MFDCILCGESKDDDEGALDDVELVLGDDERGVCDDCFSKLPAHVIDWAEEVARRD